MILKVTEQNGITIVEFVDVTRFTLASADEVKTELRPLLNNKDCRMLFDFHDIEFVDSSAIGCIIALFSEKYRLQPETLQPYAGSVENI